MKSFSQLAIAKSVDKLLSDNGSEELVDAWNAQKNIEDFNVVSVNSTKHRRVKIKDPNNYPKKMSGYNYFYSVNRERVLDDPKIKAPDVKGELIRLWKGLSKDERDEWSASSAELHKYWKDKIQR